MQIGKRNESDTFIESLFLNEDLKEQIRCIQKFKSGFVKNFSSASPTDGALLDLQILLNLYLHPDHSLLRKSVEWIIEAVCTNKTVDPILLKKALCDTSLNLVQSAVESGILSDVDIGVAAAWAISFTCIAMFDKEYPFLDANCKIISDSATSLGEADDKLMRLDDTSPLIHFLSIVDKLFVKFSKVISAQEADSSAEVARYVDCCGECMRAIMTTIKSRRGMYVAQHGSDKWIALIDSVIKNGCTLLQSQLVHKDTVTATAMSVVCLQWVSRYRIAAVSGTAEMTPTTQLTIILRLLNLAPLIGEEGDIELDSDMTSLSTGVHDDLLRHVASFPIVSRCAILRACLTAVDDEVLSAVAYRGPGTWATTTWSTSQSTPLLLGPLFDAVVAVCSHSLPLVQLYGLQTLECWFNCLDAAISGAKELISPNMFINKSRLEALTPVMRRISGLLMSTWSHPSKQVIELQRSSSPALSPQGRPVEAPLFVTEAN